MSVNDNGFLVYEIPYTSGIGYITEGAIIGMAFGWIVGVILLYSLGLWLVKKITMKYLMQSQSSSNMPRPRRPSSSSDEPALKGNQQPMSRLDPEITEKGAERPKRKVYEQNPTMELIQTTHENMEEGAKKRKAYQPHMINLELQERIDPKQN